MFARRDHAYAGDTSMESTWTPAQNERSLDTSIIHGDPQKVGELTQEEIARLGEADLQLDSGTAQEELANRDPLFGRSYPLDHNFSARHPADRQRALAFLRAELEAVKEDELFNSLPRFQSLDNGGSAGKVSGGGGVAGPSAVDAVDMGKLLEECGALPSNSRGRSGSARAERRS